MGDQSNHLFRSYCKIQNFYHNTTMKFFIGYMAILALAVLFIDDASAVQCGGYTASSCEYCPSYRTRQCSGDCAWSSGECFFKPILTSIQTSEGDASIKYKTAPGASVQQGKPIFFDLSSRPPANDDDFGK